MRIQVDQTVPAFDSYAAERTRGLYNVDADDGRRFRLDVEVPVEKEGWQIGVVVGPSGSGKSSILRELAEHRWQEYEPGWDAGGPIIQSLSGLSSYEKATASLAAVGLGSVPSWLRPRHVLSMGEGFRADMANMLIMTDGVEGDFTLDEFTSVLDRQVAQVGAGAFAKAWRRSPGRRIILFSCHYDILDWVQPDWWIDTAEGADQLVGDREVIVAREGDFQAASHRARYRGDQVGAVVC